MNRQLLPIKENSEVVYRFVVLYFPAKFPCSKQLGHVDTAGLSVVTKDHVSQGAREKGLNSEAKGETARLLLCCPIFPTTSCPKSGLVWFGF